MSICVASADGTLPISRIRYRISCSRYTES